MKTPCILRASLLAAAFGAALSANAVVLDDFSVGQPEISRSDVGSASGVATIAPGVARKLEMTQFINDDPGNARSRFGVKSGSLNFSNDVEAQSNAAVTYDYDTAIDLSGTSALSLDVLTADIGYSVRAFVRDSVGDEVVYDGFVDASLSPHASLLTFLQGSADLRNVKRVTLLLGTQSYGVDSRLANFQAVPEPASMIALGVGALGLLRRRKKA